MSELAQLQRDKRRALAKNNLREVANLCNLLGQKLQQAGDHEGSLEQHREEGALCEALEDTVGKAVSHRRMGEVYCDMGNWDAALDHQNTHLTLAKEAGSLVEEQRAHATIGRTHLQRAEDTNNGTTTLSSRSRALTQAEDAFLRALSTCQRLKGEVGTMEHCQMRCRIYLNLGLVLDLRGNTKKAQEFIGQAVDICSNHGLHDDAQRCHAALGIILLRQGLFTRALQEGQKALAFSNKLHDKALLCDGYSFLAQVHLHSSSYEAAKKCYYKAYKLKHPDIGERELITNNLKTVVNLCKTEDELLLLGEVAGDKFIKLYEKLGDGIVKFGLFTKAIEYYHKMLECALKLDKEPSFLAPIYFSLASTYCDNKQFKEAKEFYQKEYSIKLQEDYNEACKTLLNIAVVNDELGEDIQTINSRYEEARNLAARAKNPKLEAYVLRQYSSMRGITELEKEELETELGKIIESNNLDPDVELSEEESDGEDDIDLDLVNFSDSESESEDLDRPRQARQKRSLVVRRNEKGETPLHKACIDGNLNMVKKLLQQGHPVNPRDNCGWLPIHEAANHGYCEIVDTLIDAGAWMSDRGGQHCDGVTPIHDAAACGNFNVMRLLLSRGASVTAKTDEGDTPLESLIRYRQRSHLTQEEEAECFQLEKELKEKMLQAGHKIPQLSMEDTMQTHPNKVDASQTQGNGNREDRRRQPRKPKSEYNVKGKGHRIESESSGAKLNEDKTTALNEKQRKLSSRNVVDVTGGSNEDIIICSQSSLTGEVADSPSQHIDDLDDDSEEFCLPQLEDLGHNDDTSATGTYLSAMNCVGSGARRAELHKSSLGQGTSRNRKIPVALVSDFEDVGDDWLEDDLGIFTKKRKRSEKSEFEYREPRKERRISPQESSQTKSLSRLTKGRQVKITSILNRYTNDIECDNKNESTIRKEVGVSRITEIELDDGDKSNSYSNNVGVLGKSVSGTGGGGVGGALRLRVRVQDRLLLVPVAGGGHNHTVGWLAEEVTRRYYQLSGLRPHLTLATQDGAVLDTSDTISLVLPGEQAELTGQVTGWDLPPLPDRYTQACQSLGLSPVPFLTSALHSVQVSAALDLGNIGRITSSQLQPVLRAVQYQHSLRSMSFASCRLGDEGFTHLIEVLPSLPALEVLDLTATSITSVNFLAMTSAVSTDKLSLKSLCSLNLSYNTLSGVKASNIATLLSLPSLVTLSLKHCSLTLSNDQLIDAGISSPLLNFHLDYNTISCSVLTSLLACTPHISSLTLSGLKYHRSSLDNHQARLGTALSGLLGCGEECRLQHLDLSWCNLVDADIEDLSSFLYRCPHLSSISLAHNPALTPTSLSTFLNELTSNLILPLSSLSLHGNKGLASGLGEKLMSTVGRIREVILSICSEKMEPTDG
ncbi:hypothetical protein Pcinc_016170 [Petrolisthes cinctipes]|uniref:Tonsoku-like protein n=1 Tax=Petrolisthes cinctipes TaxID=88211 RepID=A0AAE1KQ00_PETCI|nr:hypothetical protein Pcinc_016170 [Petrolisthes cinctipes]